MVTGLPCPICNGLGARRAPELRHIGLLVTSNDPIAKCDACSGTGVRPSAEVLEATERKIDEAMRRMEAELARAMFPVYEGPAEKPPPWHQQMRWKLRARWYGVRAWIAAKILRVSLSGEEDW